MRLQGGRRGQPRPPAAAVVAVARVMCECALAGLQRGVLVPQGLCRGLLRCQSELCAMGDGLQLSASCVSGQPCSGQVRMCSGCCVAVCRVPVSDGPRR